MRWQFVVAIAAFLAACASTPNDQSVASVADTRSVPSVAAIATSGESRIGDVVIARYGDDFGASAALVSGPPIIALMPVRPPSPSTVAASNRLRYPLYPPPPPPGAEAYPPYSEAVERALIGGIVGGLGGAQVRSGGGRAGAAGLGAAMGALVGLGTSGNPCAAPNGGTVAGALVGGILGNQVGSGGGRTAATAVGAALGAIAGTRAGAPQADCR